MNELDLPPRRPLPPRTRDRIRRAVGSAPALGPSRTPPAVAAAVTVLAAGALIVAQSVTGTPDDFRPGLVPPTGTTSPGPSSGPSSDLAPAVAAAALDRCAAAAPGLPPRDRWRAVLSVQDLGVTVVAAVVDGKPLICQTTDATVTVTDPDATPAYARGTRTGLLLNSPEGVVAGVADPSWGKVGIYVDDGPTEISAGTRGGGGFFVFIAGPAPGGHRVRVYELVGDNSDPPDRESVFPVGTPPPPAAEIVDRPDTPAAGDQDLLAACLAASPLGTGTGWQPGAGVPFRYDGRLLLTRHGDRLAMCQSEPKTDPTFTPLLPPTADDPLSDLAPCTVWHQPVQSETSAVAGVLAAEAASVVLHFPAGDPVLVPVVNSTFLSPPLFQPSTIEKVEVYDEDHVLRYEGPPACQTG